MSELEQLLLMLLRSGMPQGELKSRMFKAHNDLVGVSAYCLKVENVRTYCGSCINRVKASLFKHYHFEVEQKSGAFIFLEKFGINNIPLYGVNKKW